MEKTIIEHGGDIYSEGRLKGRELLDFSSNINPLGIPQEFKDNIHKILEEAVNYPDLKYRESKKRLSEYLNLPQEGEEILLGNGAAELIDLSLSLIKKLCIAVPSFGEYEGSALKHHAEVKYSYLTADMEYDYKDILESMKQCQGLIIGNPNNPNGGIINKKAFSDILDYCEKNSKLIIIDEAFIEFTGCSENSFLKEAMEYSCLIVIRAVTKFFALPGIRFGYAVMSNSGAAEEIRKKQLPWNVNSFAEGALKYIFKDKEYSKKTVELIQEERGYLSTELQKIPYIEKVYKSRANYLLIKLKGSTDEDIFQKCLKEGILIRRCSSYRGLDSRFIRIAVKDREKNYKLINALNNFI